MRTGQNNGGLSKYILKKQGQEEMVGFALIMIVVSVILLIFLWFSLSNKPTESTDYQINSFLDSAMQYTTECQKITGEYLKLKDLIFSCDKEEKCLNGDKSCKVLEKTFTEIIEVSFRIGETGPTQGYALNLTRDGVGLEGFPGKTGGEVTNKPGPLGRLDFTKSGIDFIINFRVYN